MGDIHKKNYDEFERIKFYDESLVQMINDRTRDTILKILKDYISQSES